MGKLQPQLRFPEFNGNWKVDKLGVLFDISAGGDIKQEFVSQNRTDIFKYPIYANAEKNKGFYGYASIYKIDGEVITIAGRGVNIGIAHSRKEKFYPIVRLLVLKPKKETSVDFFEYAINNFDIVVESTGVPQLTAPQISNYEIFYTDFKEQTKIANFLSAIDEKINHLKEKKSLLEDYKKGIMQKIFNQEIRFKDDNGDDFEDWEIKTLGVVADFFKGKGLPKNHIKDDGSFKCIHYGELFTKYNELIKNVISKTDIYDKPFLSIANDVLMPTSDVTPNGLATASCILEDGVILGGDVLIIRQKKKVLDGLFLSFYIAQFREKVMKLVSGSTVYHLYGSDMKNLEIVIPCLKEQTKIATFLSAIDDKIELVLNQIQDTQEYKKGLLQQMFV